MNITLHTVPSMSPPEFSIIVHTEGGPTTIITWSGPDGKMHNETSQIIVDTSYKSVYENRLRVKSREGGTYTYTIINRRVLEPPIIVQDYATVMGS